MNSWQAGSSSVVKPQKACLGVLESLGFPGELDLSSCKDGLKQAMKEARTRLYTIDIHKHPRRQTTPNKHKTNVPSRTLNWMIRNRRRQNKHEETL